MFYLKLAIINIKKNSQTYFPYMLTCIFTVIIYYIMTAISKNEALGNIIGGDSLMIIFNLGSNIIAIFSLIFLFYTNNFIMKRRRKELGLYNILGMEKRHISKILVFETLFIGIISLALGLLLGIIFGKLIFLILLKILHFTVVLKFSISILSIIKTVILFIIIFTLILIANLFQITFVNPIELLKSAQTGEKEPKTKFVIALIGIITLIIGYYIALKVENPIEALTIFFVAVLFVMIGTYCIFTAGSIVILKLLRNNKKFYYKTKHFVSVSSMIYRMKQNAVGLANICILSTAVLIILSTTVSLYVGMEDILKYRYPKEVSIVIEEAKEDDINKINEIIQQTKEKYNLEIKDTMSYEYLDVCASRKNNEFNFFDTGFTVQENSYIMNFIPLDNYNLIENKNCTLNKNEVIVIDLVEDKNKKFNSDTILLNNKEFKVKDINEDIVIDDTSSVYLMNGCYIIMQNEEIIKEIYNKFYQDKKINGLDYSLEFNVKADKKIIKQFSNELKSALKSNINSLDTEFRELSRENFYSLYGSILFLGIFLGILFLMATVLIIYYKQISEGLDDKYRFEIMQKVGMSKSEIKSSIGSQILIVFFLPILVAIIHIIFAFGIIVKLLALFQLTNVNLFVACTIGTIFVFILIYIMVYFLTAKVYYRIVQ